MTRSAASEARAKAAARWPAILQSGFRPFFLLCGLQASLFILLWTAGWAIGWDLPLGDNAITIEFGNEVSLDLNQKALALAEYFDTNPFPGLIECVPE